MGKSVSEIKAIREQTMQALGNRVGNDDGIIYIMTCCGTGCTSSGSLKDRERLAALIERDNMQDKVRVVKTGCFGLCAEGPIIMIFPENIMYTNVGPDDINEIWESHIMNGHIVERLRSENELDFFSKQMRIALRNCGRIDPENIDEYFPE